MVTNDFLETLRHFTLISVLFSGGNWQIWTMGTFWMSNSRQKFIWNSFPLIPPSYVAHSDPATPGTGHIWIACQLQINKQTGEAKMKIQRKEKIAFAHQEEKYWKKWCLLNDSRILIKVSRPQNVCQWSSKISFETKIDFHTINRAKR